MQYARRQRNRDIFFKAIFFFVIEMVMILFVMLYYVASGVDDTTVYGTVVLKYCCAVALHLMQYPEIWNSI